MKVEVEDPEDFLGIMIGDLSSRRRSGRKASSIRQWTI